MDGSTSAMRIWHVSKSLEKQLLTDTRLTGPERLGIRERLIQCYSHLLEVPCEDASDVEASLWKVCFYRPMVELRRRKEQHVHRNSAEAGRIAQSLLDHLHRASSFYNNLLKRHHHHISTSPRSREICYQTLIYLGDLQRYEQFANANIAERHWGQSFRTYQLASLLDPRPGNAHNQMAVIQGYWRNDIAAMTQYFISLAVKHPFQTASRNLQVLFSQARRRVDQTLQRVAQTATLESHIRQLDDDRWPDMHRLMLHVFGTLYDCGRSSYDVKDDWYFASVTQAIPEIVEALDRMVIARMRQSSTDEDDQAKVSVSVLEMIVSILCIVESSCSVRSRRVSMALLQHLAALAAASCVEGRWHLLSVVGVVCEFFQLNGIPEEYFADVPTRSDAPVSDLEGKARQQFWAALASVGNRLQIQFDGSDPVDSESRFLREQIELRGLTFLGPAYQACDDALSSVQHPFDLQNPRVTYPLEITCRDLQAKVRARRILQCMRELASKPLSPLRVSPVNGQFLSSLDLPSLVPSDSQPVLSSESHRANSVHSFLNAESLAPRSDKATKNRVDQDPAAISPLPQVENIPGGGAAAATPKRLLESYSLFGRIGRTSPEKTCTTAVCRPKLSSESASTVPNNNEDAKASPSETGFLRVRATPQNQYGHVQYLPSQFSTPAAFLQEYHTGGLPPSVPVAAMPFGRALNGVNTDPWSGPPSVQETPAKPLAPCALYPPQAISPFQPQQQQYLRWANPHEFPPTQAAPYHVGGFWYGSNLPQSSIRSPQENLLPPPPIPPPHYMPHYTRTMSAGYGRGYTSTNAFSAPDAKPTMPSRVQW